MSQLPHNNMQTNVTIEINGRAVSEEEAKQMIFDRALATKIEQVKAAIGDLPVELVFQGDLKNLELIVRNCPDELKPELNRRLAPYI
jgi:hypothetical protein